MAGMGGSMSAFTLNGHPVDLRMDVQTPLLWALRCGANLTGAKYGCRTGECGACMVMVDGQALPSCQMTLAQAEGAPSPRLRASAATDPCRATGAGGRRRDPMRFLYARYRDGGAALLAANADPSADDIAKAMTNLCRCGIYPRLVRAIQRAGRVMRGMETIAAVPPGGAQQRKNP
jgi:isoquinoline 1-oxidoreductase alpha subunit